MPPQGGHFGHQGQPGPQAGFGGPGPGPGYSPGGSPDGTWGRPAKKNGAGMVKWGKVLTALGALVLIGAIALGVFGGMKIASATEAFEGGATHGAADEQVEIDLAAGEDLALWTTSVAWECTGSAGLSFQEYPGTQTFTPEGRTYHRAGTIVADSDGPHTVSCDSEFVANDMESIGGFVGSVFGLVGAGFAAVLALILLVIGGLLWLLGAKKNKEQGPVGNTAYHM